MEPSGTHVRFSANMMCQCHACLLTGDVILGLVIRGKVIDAIGPFKEAIFSSLQEEYAKPESIWNSVPPKNQHLFESWLADKVRQAMKTKNIPELIHFI